MASLKTVTKPPAEPPAKAWWRTPFVWLVFGLPASAVVAATASGIIAVRNADPVVDEYTASLRQPAAESIERGSAHDSTEPAEVARNHAATTRH